MRMIGYMSYVKRVENRLNKFYIYACNSNYGYTNLYKFKFNFTKTKLYNYQQVVEMFIRYMDHDIEINWDMKR